MKFCRGSKSKNKPMFHERHGTGMDFREWKDFTKEGGRWKNPSRLEGTAVKV